MKTESEAACVALINGTMDVCSGAPFHNALLTCDRDAINAALNRTFTLRMKLGLFDPIDAQPYWHVPLSAVDTAASRDNNLLATQSSMVLLKHDGVTLPLAPGKRIAVIGPHANATTDMAGNYLGQLCDDNAFGCIVSPFEAIAALNAGGTTRMAAGTKILTNMSGAGGWGDALALAASSDIVVLMLGIDGTVEGESSDRTSIDLPPVQHALAAAVAALGKPIVVVLLHGGSVDTTAERDDARVGAIIDAFYPGVLGGTVIASTLFGGNDHLGGKMAFTTYAASYINDIKMSEMELDVGPGRGYRFFTGTPVYPFGHGLSLSTFALTLVSGPANGALVTEAAPSTTLTYVVRVANTGARTADEVVMAFFAPKSTPSQPKSKLQKQLFAFERVHLAPGASTTLTFSVDSATLYFVDRDSAATVSTPGTFDIVFTNGVDNTLHNAVTVSGAEVLVATYPH